MPSMPLPTAQTSPWLTWLQQASEDTGYFEPLGARYHAFFRDEGPQLLVCFDSLADLCARAPGDLPPAWALAEAEGWSVLSLISCEDSWYRDARIWGYFDRLIDEGFFEDFDAVTFYGAGQAAHAACAYAVAAPGAQVLALGPVATLDPQVAGWDQRDRRARRYDFRSRFGYGPDMIAGAAAVTLIYDPEIPEQAMHGMLYRQPREAAPAMHCFAAPGLGEVPGALLDQMGLLEPLLRAAMDGRPLGQTRWAGLWRARRHNTSWLLSRAARAAEDYHPAREKVFLQQALAVEPDQPRLQKRLDAVNRRLAQQRIAESYL